MIVRIPGVSDAWIPVEAAEPIFIVVPLENFELRIAHLYAKEYAAPDHRTALLRARADGIIEKFLADRGKKIDGWYVGRISAATGHIDEYHFFSKDAK